MPPAISPGDAQWLRYRRALIQRGVYHFPVAAKQGSLSLAHSDEDLTTTVEAAARAAEVALRS